MPITGFTWNRTQGCDVHILRNNQPSLPLDDVLIVVEEITNSKDPDNNPKLEFKTLKDILSAVVVTPPPEFGRALFVPTWFALGNQTGPLVTFNGITVNVVTGEIRAESHAAPLITSFFINVILEPSSGNSLSLPANFQPPRIIVHVHNDITSAWVTPASLTARPDIFKGISLLALKVISTKPIERIVWGSDDTFQHPMSQFLLNGFDPFDGVTNLPPGGTFPFPPSVLFDNRRLFPVNEVFIDPMHFEVHYAGQTDPVRMTIPTHLSHLIQTGQKFDDGAGNDVFEVTQVDKKAQFKASVYAAFNDGTIGDITNHHGLTWERGPGVNVNDITFDGDGAFTVAASAVGKTLPVRARLPASLSRTGLTEATGNIIVAQSWLNANPIAERLTGSPLQLPASDVPNILFVAEGFTSRDEFRKAALSVYNKLRTEPKTTPWNHLFTNRMNAWMLFEASRETAASVLYESLAFENVALDSGSQANVALPVWEMIDIASNRLDDHAGLTLIDLVLNAGLPLPGDQRGRNDTLVEWRQLVDANLGTGNLNFSDPEFNFWRQLSRRRLVDERDTVWGLRCGEKPKYAGVIPSNLIFFNDEARIQRSNFDLFLSRVHADTISGDLIGEQFWARDRQGKFGKDYGLVIFLVGGLRSIGTRFSEQHFPQGLVNTGLGVGLVDDRVPLAFLGPQFSQTFPYFLWQPTPGAPSFDMVPFPVPADVSLGAFATIAHELCHSFNLDDEYTRPGRGPIVNQNVLKTVYNLQGRNDLLTANQLSGEKIKWRWPRIRKAGVLEAAPVVGPPFTVTLRAGDAGQFNLSDTVRFRQRDLLNTALADLSSPELKVLGKNENNHTLVLEPSVTTGVDWTLFGPTSLLYVPVKAPSETRNNPTNDVHAEVLSPLLRHQINQTHNPQSKEPCAPDTNDTQEPVNLPSNLNRPEMRRQIVGLFSGGREFSCDVYHASGECIMRKETARFIQTIGGIETSRDRQTYQFCHVCRYSLVDQIDPKQHDQIDKEYDENYPLTDKPTSALKVIGIILLILLVVGGIGYLLAKDKDE